MPRRFFLETLGCQMNVHDSETIAGVLISAGLEPADRPEQADVLLVNTCSVREKPHHKVFSRLGDWRKLKQRRPGLIIGVCGCMAQTIPDQIRRRAPYVDFVIGPRGYGRLRELVEEAASAEHMLACTDLDEDSAEGLPMSRAPGVCAWVTVMDGCNHFCAYCIVPYARGRERSRPPDGVLAEVEGLVAQGYREVTLLGQNVNNYGRDLDEGTDFAGLLERVARIEGLDRLRFATSHPKDCSQRLIEVFGASATICEHFHLPVQSGDDEVLRRMGRAYTAEQYVDLIARLRAAKPGLAVTTDVMVGFPGETEAQFENTLALMETIRFDQAFMFKYNTRPGTRAAEFPGQTAEGIKQERLQRLVARQNETGREQARRLEGSDVEVLVESLDEPQRGRPGHLRGRSRTNRLTLFEGPEQLIGRLVDVRVTEGFVWGLKGTGEAPL
jgi:tRNA-2-methylthio-N6-dimethylallyladenosine synthase